jgi:hypothetical protein
MDKSEDTCSYIVVIETRRWGYVTLVNQQGTSICVHSCDKAMRILCCWRCRSRTRSRRWEFFRIRSKDHRIDRRDVELSHVEKSTLNGTTAPILVEVREYFHPHQIAVRRRSTSQMEP